MKSLEYIRKKGFKVGERGSKKLHTFVYRHLSVYLTFILQFLPITPNIVSFLGSFVALIATVFFAFDNSWFFLLGIFLMYFAEVLDYVDGCLARTKNMSSTIMWRLFEDFYHEIPRQFVFFFIGFGAYIATSKLIYLYLGTLSLVSQLLVMYLSQLRKAILGNYGIKYLTEDPNNPAFMEDNPFIQKGQMLIFRLLVLPMRQIKLILLALVIVSFWVHDALYYALFFYGPFLTIRLCIFFINTYLGMLQVERQLNKKTKH